MRQWVRDWRFKRYIRKMLRTGHTLKVVMGKEAKE